MNCVICKTGETCLGRAIVTLQRGEHTLVFKDVPAEICDNCGEYYLSEDVAKRLYKQAEMSIQRGAEVEIRRYVALNTPA